MLKELSHCVTCSKQIFDILNKREDTKVFILSSSSWKSRIIDIKAALFDMHSMHKRSNCIDRNAMLIIKTSE